MRKKLAFCLGLAYIISMTKNAMKPLAQQLFAAWQEQLLTWMQDPQHFDAMQRFLAQNNLLNPFTKYSNDFSAFFTAPWATSFTPASSAGSAPPSDLRERLEQLEAELERLRQTPAKSGSKTARKPRISKRPARRRS
ncbi:MAG: hypothetical protein AB7G80_00495 [Dongiaceae bacterium]